VELYLHAFLTSARDGEDAGEGSRTLLPKKGVGLQTQLGCVIEEENLVPQYESNHDFSDIQARIAVSIRMNEPCWVSNDDDEDDDDDKWAL
jgi:hypothetical protein